MVDGNYLLCGIIAAQIDILGEINYAVNVIVHYPYLMD